jgi:hypothetical protein
MFLSQFTRDFWTNSKMKDLENRWIELCKKINAKGRYCWIL